MRENAYEDRRMSGRLRNASIREIIEERLREDLGLPGIDPDTNWIYRCKLCGTDIAVTRDAVYYGAEILCPKYGAHGRTRHVEWSEWAEEYRDKISRGTP